ncbi:hypothetical protein THRCLA_10157 [Thraustotheca clavata]|uniref:Uncharacterized protein n=1 Tax=Thraustotheca clavata TaxID=74557 RepID=A0A1V9YT08_9STRA|nr:hypothetical protein THRCLA_10157 [Thraustotheca clavata]
MFKQLELEAMTWKRESLQKQALLDDLECKNLTNSFVLSTRSQATHQLHPAIPALLELGNQIDQPDVVYQGSRILDGHTLFFHLLRGQDTTRDNYTIHFIAYEPSTAQEDILTFYASDIIRLIAEGEKYLMQPKHEPLTQELISILFTTLAVGFKNGSFYLVEKGIAEAERSAPKTKTTSLFHGSMLLQYQDTKESIPVALCINEIHASALCEVWSLEIHATSIDEEWSCIVSMDQVCKICPDLINYKPHEATLWHNEHRINVNAVVLAPLFKTLVLKALPENQKYELVSTLQIMPPPLMDSQPDIIDSKVKLKKDWNQPLSYRGLKTINGTCYYLTMRELWDGRVLIEISLYDSYTDKLVTKTFEEQQLLPFIHCVAALQPISTPVKLQAGISAQIRPAIIRLLPHALILDTKNNSLKLDPLQLQSSLPPKYSLPTKSISFEHQGRPLSTEYLPAQSDVIVENVIPRLLSVLHQHHQTRGVRLRDKSLAIVQVFGYKLTEGGTSSFYSLLKLTRISAKGIDDPRWLVVQRDIPIAFVIQLWCPLRL